MQHFRHQVFQFGPSVPYKLLMFVPEQAQIHHRGTKKGMTLSFEQLLTSIGRSRFSADHVEERTRTTTLVQCFVRHIKHIPNNWDSLPGMTVPVVSTTTYQVLAANAKQK